MTIVAKRFDKKYVASSDMDTTPVRMYAVIVGLFNVTIKNMTIIKIKTVLIILLNQNVDVFLLRNITIK
jgi:hypothetical protein